RRRRTLRRNTDAKTGSLALVRQILDRILDGPAASMCHYREPREGMALVEDFRGDILDSVAAAQLLVFSTTRSTTLSGLALVCTAGAYARNASDALPEVGLFVESSLLQSAKIAVRGDADDFSFRDHGNVPEPAVLHETQRVDRRAMRRDCARFAGHDVAEARRTRIARFG